METEAIAATARTTRQHLGASARQYTDAVLHRVFDRFGEHSTHWCAVELGADRLQKGVGTVVLEQQQNAGIRAELAGAHQARGNKIVGNFRAALGQGAGENDHRIDAAQFQINRLAGPVGGLLEHQSGAARARVADRADFWM